MQKDVCLVCGRVDGESFIHHFTKAKKKIKIKNYHVIPPFWKKEVLSEFRDLTAPLCQRCYDCCAPHVIANYNIKRSYEVARVLTNNFPLLKFEIVPHCCGKPKCPSHGRLTMVPSRK